MPSIKRARISQKQQGRYHHGDLKAALKSAALSLVREKGTRGFSLNEASRLAGVSVGAPYRHFEDKDALLAELACEGADLLARELETAADRVKGIREKILQAGLAYLLFARRYPDYFAVLFEAGLDKSKYPELERKSKASFGVLLALAERYERTPQFGMQRALYCWALIHGLATLAIQGELPPSVLEEHDQVSLRGLLDRALSPPYK